MNFEAAVDMGNSGTFMISSGQEENVVFLSPPMVSAPPPVTPLARRGFAELFNRGGHNPVGFDQIVDQID